jgi:aminopeptidase N
MARAKGIDLLSYKNTWLDSKDFPIAEAIAILQEHSPSLDLLSQMNAEFEVIQSDDLDYEGYWDASTSVHFKQHIIKKYHQVLPKSVIEKAFATDTIPIRQALAVSILGISPSENNKDVWKNSFESLLKDKSYVTKELALIKLWSTFEKDRGNYLDQLDRVDGLPNKNVRLLWLTLALVTPEYRAGEKPVFFTELSSYTGSNYSQEVRQTAFQFLEEVGGLSEAVFRELIQATNHHSWQFRNFARRLLDRLWEDEGIRIQLQETAKRLNGDDLLYFNTKLNLE